MAAKPVILKIQVQKWVVIIRNVRASKLKIDDYCWEHDIFQAAYYWLRKVKEMSMLFLSTAFPKNA